MSNYETVSLLRELRIQFNYSLQDVANYLGVSKSAVSKWEFGDYIKTENLYELAKLYGVTFSELYEGKLNKEDKKQFWKRNFDLSNIEITEEVTNKNIDEVRVLFERIALIKKIFLKMLPVWANDKLTNDEKEKFLFIKQYFKIDNDYHSYITGANTFIGILNEKVLF